MDLEFDVLDHLAMTQRNKNNLLYAGCEPETP